VANLGKYILAESSAEAHDGDGESDGDNCQCVFTLWEIVNKFDLPGFYSIGFIHPSMQFFLLMSRLKHISWTFDPSAIQAELRSIEESITIEMFKHKFVRVEQSLSKFFENPDLFGSEVSAKFSDAKSDIAEAGDCIAVGAATAGVFHLMRVVESGMRAFAKNLGLSQIVVDKKRGKTIPVEFSQWEKVLNQLPEKIDAKIGKMPAGPKKQRAQEFYYGALHELEGFKDAWRNHVMHVRSRYTSEDASAVLSHVHRFMKSLADNGVTG
jgi:hypothetical protein